MARIYNIVRARVLSGDSPGNDFTNLFESAFNKSKERFSSAKDSAPEVEHEKADEYDPELAGYYANLEVPYGSDLKHVKKAWKQLLQKYHPDLHSNNAEKRQVAHELTQKLNHAYEKLCEQLSTENN